MLVVFGWLLGLVLFFAEDCRAEGNGDCLPFSVVFSAPLRVAPERVFLGDDRVGRVTGFRDDPDAPRVEICVERKFAGRFEQQSVCYLDAGNLQVYNVWSNGIDLKRGAEIVGLTSKFELLLYEAKVIVRAIFR